MLNPSSGGRDVLFRLAVATDPQAKAALAEWGKLLAKTQETATAAAIESVVKVEKAKEKSTKKTAADAQRERDKEAVAQIKQDRLVAGHYLKEHLKAIDDKVRAEKKAEEEVTRWKESLRRNSRELEFRENARLARESAKAKADAEREAMRAVNMERIAMIRRREGHSQAISGGMQLARGVAYSGMIGERNTQTVLNTLLAVEAGGSLVQGARGLHKGIGTAAAAGSPLAAMAGPAMAAAAALAGVAAAGASVASTFRDIRENGFMGGSSGGFSDTVGTKQAGLLASATKMLPKGLRQILAKSGMAGAAISPFLAGLGAAASTGLSDDELAANQRVAEEKRLQLSKGAAALNRLGGLQRQDASGSLDTARQNLRDNLLIFSEAKAGGLNNETTQAAATNLRASMEQMRSISLDIARSQAEGSRAQLQNLRAAASEAKQIADATKQAYQSDILKAATSSLEDRVRLREIDRKRKAGDTLTGSEIEFASGFNTFRDVVESSAQKRADEAGLGHIFAPDKDRVKEAAKRQAEFAEEIVKTELTVTQKNEVVVRLEGDAKGWAEEIVKGISESADFVKDLEAMKKKILDDARSEMRGAMTQFANAKRPNL